MASSPSDLGAVRDSAPKNVRLLDAVGALPAPSPVGRKASRMASSLQPGPDKGAPPMTFSLVAHCPRTQQVGVAAVTALPAVGKLVSHARPGTGAIATQALTNPYYGFDGLKLLGEGRDVQSILEELLENDPHRQKRQVAVLDAQGRTSTWTGSDLPSWAGDIQGQGYSAQGNRLTSPKVVEAIAEAMERHRDLELARRLLLAIEAGHAAGGDRKQERSGTILVYDTEEYPLWDIRADDAEDPVEELHRLFEIFEQQLIPLVRKLPRRGEPEGELTEGPD